MRARDREWSYPALRFFGALFIPPAIACLVLSVILTITGDTSVLNIPSVLVSLGIGALKVTTVPSIVFFLILENLYESNQKARNTRIRFALIGAAIGAVFGSGIGPFFEAIVLYFAIGAFSGFIAAYAIFPKSDLPNPES